MSQYLCLMEVCQNDDTTHLKGPKPWWTKILLNFARPWHVNLHSLWSQSGCRQGYQYDPFT
jgi:hypothetical protein